MVMFMQDLAATVLGSRFADLFGLDRPETESYDGCSSRSSKIPGSMMCSQTAWSPVAARRLWIDCGEVATKKSLLVLRTSKATRKV